MVDNPTKFQPNDPRLIGNKFGKNGGRPRKLAPQPEECVELGEDLLEWLTEETDELRFLFQKWYSLRHGIMRKDWKNLIQMPEFLPYYEAAKAILAEKCIDGTVKEGFGNRYLRLHDRDLVDEENEHARFEAELKKAANESQQQQKVVFEVNYKNDSNNSVQILPETVSNSASSSPQ